MAKMLGRAAKWEWRDGHSFDKKRMSNIERHQWQRDIEQDTRHIKYARKCKHKYLDENVVSYRSSIVVDKVYQYLLIKCKYCSKEKLKNANRKTNASKPNAAQGS